MRMRMGMRFWFFILLGFVGGEVLRLLISLFGWLGLYICFCLFLYSFLAFLLFYPAR